MAQTADRGFIVQYGIYTFNGQPDHLTGQYTETSNFYTGSCSFSVVIFGDTEAQLSQKIRNIEDYFSHNPFEDLTITMNGFTRLSKSHRQNTGLNLKTAITKVVNNWNTTHSAIFQIAATWQEPTTLSGREGLQDFTLSVQYNPYRLRTVGFAGTWTAVPNGTESATEQYFANVNNFVASQFNLIPGRFILVNENHTADTEDKIVRFTLTYQEFYRNVEVNYGTQERFYRLFAYDGRWSQTWGYQATSINFEVVLSSPTRGDLSRLEIEMHEALRRPHGDFILLEDSPTGRAGPQLNPGNVNDAGGGEYLAGILDQAGAQGQQLKYVDLRVSKNSGFNPVVGIQLLKSPLTTRVSRHYLISITYQLPPSFQTDENGDQFDNERKGRITHNVTIGLDGLNRRLVTIRGVWAATPGEEAAQAPLFWLKQNREDSGQTASKNFELFYPELEKKELESLGGIFQRLNINNQVDELDKLCTFAVTYIEIMPNSVFSYNGFRMNSVDGQFVRTQTYLHETISFQYLATAGSLAEIAGIETSLNDLIRTPLGDLSLEEFDPQGNQAVIFSYSHDDNTGFNVQGTITRLNSPLTVFIPRLDATHFSVLFQISFEIDLPQNVLPFRQGRIDSVVEVVADANNRRTIHLTGGYSCLPGSSAETQFMNQFALWATGIVNNYGTFQRVALVFSRDEENKRLQFSSEWIELLVTQALPAGVLKIQDYSVEIERVNPGDFVREGFTERPRRITVHFTAGVDSTAIREINQIDLLIQPIINFITSTLITREPSFRQAASNGLALIEQNHSIAPDRSAISLTLTFLAFVAGNLLNSKLKIAASIDLGWLFHGRWSGDPYDHIRQPTFRIPIITVVETGEVLGTTLPTWLPPPETNILVERFAIPGAPTDLTWQLIDLKIDEDESTLGVPGDLYTFPTTQFTRTLTYRGYRQKEDILITQAGGEFTF